jgi:hypothetical protein
MKCVALSPRPLCVCGRRAYEPFCITCVLTCGLAHVHVAQVRSILLTSGTLNPLDSFASELRIPFPVRLENEVRLTQLHSLTSPSFLLVSSKRKADNRFFCIVHLDCST